jgi:hypothetical protein
MTRGLWGPKLDGQAHDETSIVLDEDTFTAAAGDWRFAERGPGPRWPTPRQNFNIPEWPSGRVSAAASRPTQNRSGRSVSRCDLLRRRQWCCSIAVADLANPPDSALSAARAGSAHLAQCRQDGELVEKRWSLTEGFLNLRQDDYTWAVWL